MAPHRPLPPTPRPWHSSPIGPLSAPSNMPSFLHLMPGTCSASSLERLCVCLPPPTPSPWLGWPSCQSSLSSNVTSYPHLKQPHHHSPSNYLFRAPDSSWNYLGHLEFTPIDPTRMCSRPKSRGLVCLSHSFSPSASHKAWLLVDGWVIY